jgi:hypothetical protein
MKIQLRKIGVIMIALFFLSGCAVFVRDDGFHHHHFHGGRWHSSLQQSDPFSVQRTAQNDGGM